MFVAMGTGAYSIGMFHLFTHAFFKALLFLGSGSVIIAMHHEQDIRHMGGLKDRLPFTYWTMVVGTLALTGFPLTAGYFSKDAIIEAAYAAHNPMALYAFWATVIAAALTAFYSWRLILLTFHGSPHDYHHYEQARESPLVMIIPLGVLAVGSIFAGFPFQDLFAGHGASEFFRDSLKLAQENGILENMHHAPYLVTVLPTVMMAVGFVIAWQFYMRRPQLPAELARQHNALYRFLLNKWYFDEIYDAIIVRPTLWLARVLWKGGDGWLIDGFGPDGVSARVLEVTQGAIRLQTGYLYHYAFAMLIGVAAVITWFMFGGRIG
jgi:NADH-quinone oxidoreductase subunit L